MKAICWQGIHEVGVEDVPDPQILNQRATFRTALQVPLDAALFRAVETPVDEVDEDVVLEVSRHV